MGPLYKRNNDLCLSRSLYTVAVLFIIAPNWEQYSCFSASESLKKKKKVLHSYHTHIKKILSQLKKKVNAQQKL